MKLSAAAHLLSFLRTTLVVLLPLLLIGWTERAKAGPVGLIRESLSEPLQSSKTWEAVQEVSRHAQNGQSDDDTNIRLLPEPMSQDEVTLCCLHANILDYYLHNILLHHEHGPHQQHHMQRLQTDLTRVSYDLQARGCNVTHFEDHQHAVAFRQKLKRMGGPQAIIKAVGEVDILFTYLQDFCVQTRNVSTI